MITGELKSQVDKIWEAFWTGGISNPISVIEQFTYLLFIRRLDEEQLKEEKKAALVGIPMKKVLFTEGQKPLRWNQFKNEDPETMFGRFTSPTVEGMSVFDHMKAGRRPRRCVCGIHEQGHLHHLHAATVGPSGATHRWG